MEPDSAEPADTGEVLVVRLGGSRYAVALGAVAEVGRPPRLTRLPGLPAWVAGVANWRGRVLPVVDLCPLLGATAVCPGPVRGAAARTGRAARLVVVVWEGVQVGLLCEAVDGTAVLTRDPGAPAPVLAPAAAALVAGLVTDADGPVGLLDVTGVLALSDSLPRVRRAG